MSKLQEWPNLKLDKTHTHFQTLEKQLDLLSSNRQKIVESFSQFQFFQSRAKRSILPFLGDIIGFIAGTPTEGEISTIRNRALARMGAIAPINFNTLL